MAISMGRALQLLRAVVASYDGLRNEDTGRGWMDAADFIENLKPTIQTIRDELQIPELRPVADYEDEVEEWMKFELYQPGSTNLPDLDRHANPYFDAQFKINRTQLAEDAANHFGLNDDDDTPEEVFEWADTVAEEWESCIERMARTGRFNLSGRRNVPLGACLDCGCFHMAGDCDVVSDESESEEDEDAD